MVSLYCVWVPSDQLRNWLQQKADSPTRKREFPPAWPPWARMLFFPLGFKLKHWSFLSLKPVGFWTGTILLFSGFWTYTRTKSLALLGSPACWWQILGPPQSREPILCNKCLSICVCVCVYTYVSVHFLHTYILFVLQRSLTKTRSLEESLSKAFSGLVNLEDQLCDFFFSLTKIQRVLEKYSTLWTWVTHYTMLWGTKGELTCMEHSL